MRFYRWFPSGRFGWLIVLFLVVAGFTVAMLYFQVKSTSAQDDRDKTTQVLAGVQQELGIATSTLAVVQAELATTTSALTAVQKKLYAASSTVQTIEKEVSRLEEELADADKRTKEQDDRIDDLSSERARVNGEIASLLVAGEDRGRVKGQEDVGWQVGMVFEALNFMIIPILFTMEEGEVRDYPLPSGNVLVLKTQDGVPEISFLVPLEN